MAASVVARCGGPASFFGLTRQLYVDQPQWIAKIQAADPAQMQAIAALAPAQQLAEVAKIAGFPQWAAMRGLPSAKLNACLADAEAPTKLVQMQTDAIATYQIPGTPSFLINGKLVEVKPGSSPWTQVEAALKAALGS
jgi:protein-disulfide isomerase